MRAHRNRGSQLKHTQVIRSRLIVSPMKTHNEAIKLVIDALIDKEHGVISDMGEIGAVGHRVVHGESILNNPL